MRTSFLLISKALVRGIFGLALLRQKGDLEVKRKLSLILLSILSASTIYAESSLYLALLGGGESSDAGSVKMYDVQPMDELVNGDSSKTYKVSLGLQGESPQKAALFQAGVGFVNRADFGDKEIRGEFRIFYNEYRLKPYFGGHIGFGFQDSYDVVTTHSVNVTDYVVGNSSSINRANRAEFVKNKTYISWGYALGVGAEIFKNSMFLLEYDYAIREFNGSYRYSHDIVKNSLTKQVRSHAILAGLSLAF